MHSLNRQLFLRPAWSSPWLARWVSAIGASGTYKPERPIFVPKIIVRCGKGDGRAQHVPTAGATDIRTKNQRSVSQGGLNAASAFAGVACGSSRAITKHSGMKPQSIEDTTKPIDTCLYLWARGRDDDAQAQWPECYDTLKMFVERCPKNQWAHTAFGGMSNACDYGGNGPSPGCWISYQNWLISALAWNPGNAQYFCADVEALMGTVGISPDTDWQEANTNTNRGMSVLYWILHNPLCNNADDSELYVQSRGSQIRTWRDTQDTSKVPLDTTIYPMQDLGLDSLLKYAALLGVNEGNAPSIITNATAYPNPTGEGTVVSFGVSREAYVTIALLDVLGHEVTAPSFGGVVEPGNLSVPLTLQELPSGTYFARIMTTYGEVQTVKIVKEQ
jgi:hypothetical protein